MGTATEMVTLLELVIDISTLWQPTKGYLGKATGIGCSSQLSGHLAT